VQGIRSAPRAGRHAVMGEGDLNTVSTSSAVLDSQGRPRHSIDNPPDVLMASRWFSQPDTACTTALLDGVVVSQQLGRDWRDRQWKPDAVAQRDATVAFLQRLSTGSSQPTP
jgi:hypothetical protein